MPRCYQISRPSTALESGGALNKYRRRALKSLARIDSPSAERLALEAWHRPDGHQEWARTMVLDCLHRIRSPHLEHRLAEAERDERQYLRDFAKRLRQAQSG